MSPLERLWGCFLGHGELSLETPQPVNSKARYLLDRGRVATQAGPREPLHPAHPDGGTAGTSSRLTDTSVSLPLCALTTPLLEHGCIAVAHDGAGAAWGQETISESGT